MQLTVKTFLSLKEVYAAGEGLIDGQDASTYGWDLDEDVEGTGYLPYSADRGWARPGLENSSKRRR